MTAKNKGKKFCEEIGPGRPALPPEEKRRPRSVKMSDEEWEEIRGKADKLGLPISEYIRLKTLVE